MSESHGTCSYICTYVSTFEYNVMLLLYLRHDFYNIIFKHNELYRRKDEPYPPPINPFLEGVCWYVYCFIIYCLFKVSVSISDCTMVKVGEKWSGKETNVSCRDVIWDNLPTFVWKGLRNLRETTFRIFGDLVEFQTRHHQNESRQCYRLSYRALWSAHLFKPTGLLARGVCLNVQRWMFGVCREMINISVYMKSAEPC
jgi:hypothetical protein